MFFYGIRGVGGGGGGGGGKLKVEEVRKCSFTK